MFTLCQVVNIIDCPYHHRFMAKKESFFIRGTVTPDNAGTFAQSTIDLSSYVSALGKSIVRIKSIEGEWAQGPNGNIPNGAPTVEKDKCAYAIWQLTTQSNSGLVSLDDRTTIGKGALWARNPDGNEDAAPTQVYSDSHLPQHYSDGFLLAVEDIYLGAQAGANWTATDDLTFNIVLECEVLTMTQSAAMALSLSQQ